ncbi:MAG: CDP-glycerol:glycerophosphate glycerophosphotransferase [Lactobacillales bacterium]|nr:CDP-glycerol:glycerophosphate glycerophosphotransferase [Lactobacillales bacterium]
MPAISIILPVYNSEKYISKCLESLTSQKFKDIEILCINDSSKDSSLKIIEKHAANDKRIKVFNQKNAGPAAARNIGLKNASSPYIMFCDSDDWYETNMCEEMYNTIKKENVDLVMCDREVSFSDGYVRPEGSINYTKLNMIGYGDFNQQNILNVRVLLWNKIFKKSIIDEYEIDFPTGFEHDDFAFILKYLTVAKNYFGIDKKLYNYFLRNNSIMSTLYSKKRSKKQEFDNLYASQSLYNFLLKHKLEKKHMNLYVAILQDQVAYCYKHLYRQTIRSFFKLVQKQLSNISLSNAIDPSFLLSIQKGKFRKAKKAIERRVDEKHFGNYMFGSVRKNDRKEVYFLSYTIFKKIKNNTKKYYYLFGMRIYKKKLKNKEDFSSYISNTKQKIFKFEVMSLKNTIMIENMYYCNEEKYILLFDCLYDKNAEAIDAYSLFQYLQSKNIPSKYILLKDNKLYSSLDNEDNIIGVENQYDFIFNHTHLISKASHVVTSFGFCNQFDSFFKSLPFLNYVFIDHGVIFFKQWVVSMYNSNTFDLILVPTKKTKELYDKINSWDQEKMILNGLPRWDLLERKPHDKKNIFIFFTWRKTFEKNIKLASKYFESIKSLLDNPKLAQLLKENDIQINLALHHSLFFNDVEIPDFNLNVNLIDMSKISSHIKTSDLLITDYSSICFDFMFLDIPVIFYRFDIDNMQLDEIDQEAVSQAMEKDNDVYNCVYSEEDALQKIKHYIKNGFVLEPENKAKNKAFFWDRKNIRESLYKSLKNIKKNI